MSSEQEGDSEYRRSVFNVPKMDCPSEERMIRMTLENFPGIRKLSFDLPARQLSAVHQGPVDELLTKLVPLKLGASLADSRVLSEVEEALELTDGIQDASEARVLKQLLSVNATMFIVEIIVGWIAQSTGLIADSLDMFADASVYGLSLYAVGKAPALKVRSARLTGYLQLLLASGVVFEVVRRALYGSEPKGVLIMAISVVALAANVFCLALLTKHRTGGVHMRATFICSSTDVIANFGVIVAGLFVTLTGSPLPDLIIGSIISVVVFGGGFRILKVARTH